VQFAPERIIFCACAAQEIVAVASFDADCGIEKFAEPTITFGCHNAPGRVAEFVIF
jgi:hypothetical protein